MNADYQAMQLQNEIFKYKMQVREHEKKIQDLENSKDEQDKDYRAKMQKWMKSQEEEKSQMVKDHEQ